jgi:hypothetical protein
LTGTPKNSTEARNGARKTALYPICESFAVIKVGFPPLMALEKMQCRSATDLENGITRMIAKTIPKTFKGFQIDRPRCCKNGVPTVVQLLNPSSDFR